MLIHTDDLITHMWNYSIACVVLAQWGKRMQKFRITGKLALFFQMQASSDPVSLQSDVSLSFALFGFNFTKNTHFPFNTRSFYDGSQFEKAVYEILN